MRYLVIQDDAQICDAITSLISTSDSSSSVEIARSVFKATSLLVASEYDLIIFDLYLPLRDNEPIEENYGNDLLTTYRESKNYGTEAVLVTKDSYADSQMIPLYNFWNISVISYTLNTNGWKDSLSRIILKVISTPRYDFLIFSALHKEALAYESTSAILGGFQSNHGCNFRDITIGKYRGLCFEALHPGPVTTAIMASKVIDQFRPKIVLMGGICAGIRGETKFLDLVVANPCWNYQSGKTKGGIFYSEPYQFQIDPEIQTELINYIGNHRDVLLSKLLAKLDINPELATHLSLSIGAAASGAGVVSDHEMIEHIKLQHRKITAIDMEMAAFYEAARYARCKPSFFAAKAVVDLGDEEKNDLYHDKACVISARFIVAFLEHWLSIKRS